MKVLEKGKPWSKQYKCTGKGNNRVGCGAKLEVFQEDLYETRHEGYDGSTDYYTTFCCSECGAETDIELPSGAEELGSRPSEGERKSRFKKFQCRPE